MLIGMDISRLAVGQRTGTEHYTWEVLAALGRLDQENRYRLYANHRPAALPPLPPRFVLRSLPWGRMWTHIRLSAELVRSTPDVLFVPAHVLPLVHPGPSVVTIHDLGYIHHPEAHPRWSRLYLRLSTLWSARQATHLLADSEATRADLLRYCRIDPAKITVAYLGVSDRFRPVSAPAQVQQISERYGIRQPYFLFVGTVQPRKNLERLIAAFARANLSGIQLVIAGKRGWLTAAIEAQASRLGIADRVHFAGYVADDDLPALLSGARAVAMPSLYEGFGLPALEAMACGTPVLASNVSSLPEVVGDAGVLVDPLNVDDIAAGLECLAEDDELRADLAARGLRRAAEWTWERCARTTLQVLSQTAKKAS